MLARIEEFGQLLRANGVRVSTAELMDAASALAAVGVEHEPQMRAALFCSLVKNEADRATFNELYGLYFHRYDSVLTTGTPSPEDELADAARLSEDRAKKLADALRDGAMTLGTVARAGMGFSSPELSELIRAADISVELDGIRSPLQVGFYAYRISEALGIEQAEIQTVALVQGVARQFSLDEQAADAVQGVVLSGFTDLRQRVRAYVAQAFARGNRDFSRQLTLDSLTDKPLMQLSQKEIAELRQEVTRLAEKLRAKLAQRPERGTRGRLDLRRTLRRSLATGGVPFDLPHRRRKPHKPRLVVLCDISDSVRAVSRFMLQLVYTLQELFDRVQSFAFVAELGELTELFRHYKLERAIELAYAGTVVNTFANSNYGHTLQQFAARHTDRITRRTTVIIIGDGRNNYHDSHAWVLEDMHRRAKQVLWLNPEPPSMWGFGDSAMKEYEPHCDRVLVVRNLRGLRTVLDHLII